MVDLEARGRDMTDNVNHPPHYTSGDAKCSHCNEPIECIDVVKHLDFALGNAMKYIWRCEYKKNKIEDLEKAIFYITQAINMERMRIQNNE